MKKYVYEGNRSGSDDTSALIYDGKTYQLGDEIALSAAERDRIAQYFVLTDKDGEDVAPGTPSPEDNLDMSATPENAESMSQTGSNVKSTSRPSAS